MQLVLLIFLWFQITLASPTRHVYRTDYVYKTETNAFYKVHLDGADYRRAKALCSVEGAKLMKPVNEIELDLLYETSRNLPKAVPEAYLWITEIKPYDIEEYDEYYDYYHEGDIKCTVINETGMMYEDCKRMLPFICKLDADDAPYDETCKVYDTGYEYSAATGSCYKIPRVALTWKEASAECQAVGAHLVVVNSETESQALMEITDKSPYLPESTSNPYFFAGFRTKEMSREFFTIFNQTLEEAGFSQWSRSEPNNLHNDEYCGSILSHDGKLNDVSCSNKYGFICEREILPSTTPISEEETDPSTAPTPLSLEETDLLTEITPVKWDVIGPSANRSVVTRRFDETNPSTETATVSSHDTDALIENSTVSLEETWSVTERSAASNSVASFFIAVFVTPLFVVLAF